MSKTLKEMEQELGVGQYGTSEDSLDAVNHPPHYTVGGIETLEVISAKLTKDQYLGYLLGNVMKYVMRHNYKGKPIEDLRKAGFYLERAITLSENK
tara:strand:+ start:204 stop:491 length:288 start_codon:yes stop_codon:yes gene_type:complete